MSRSDPPTPSPIPTPARTRIRWAPLVLLLGTAALATACVYADGGRRGSRYGDPYSRSGPYYRTDPYTRSGPYSRSGPYYDPRWHDRREWEEDRREWYDDRREHQGRPARPALDETGRWKDMRQEQKEEMRDLERSQARERERLKGAGEWDKQDKQRQRAVSRDVQRQQKEEREEVREDYQDRSWQRR